MKSGVMHEPGSYQPDSISSMVTVRIEYLVGTTTNKTHARNYEKAITGNTAALLRVHPSNYKIHGFTSEVPLEEMVQIAHKHGLILIDVWVQDLW